MNEKDKVNNKATIRDKAISFSLLILNPPLIPACPFCFIVGKFKKIIPEKVTLFLLFYQACKNFTSLKPAS
jgi:hypothetical protein